MTYARSLCAASRLLIAAVCGAGIGGFFAFASAQDRPPGELNMACAAQCAENGNDAEFCGQVCWVPDPEVAARSYPVNWTCYTSCRERGGGPRDCMPTCRSAD